VVKQGVLDKRRGKDAKFGYFRGIFRGCFGGFSRNRIFRGTQKGGGGITERIAGVRPKSVKFQESAFRGGCCFWAKIGVLHCTAYRNLGVFWNLGVFGTGWTKATITQRIDRCPHGICKWEIRFLTVFGCFLGFYPVFSS